MRLRLALSLMWAGLIVLPPASAGWAQASGQESRAPGASAGSLTLAQALLRALERHPEMTVSELEIEAASARLLQAGLKPNPELSAEVENFAAVGGSGLFRHTESTLQMSQRIELGGKRDLRIKAAEVEQGVARAELELKKSQLMAMVSRAFAAVMVGQQLLANQRDLTRLSRQALSVVGERAAAGKVSPVEQTRAAVALASAELEEARQGLALTASMDDLAALWGGSHEDFDGAEGRFEIPPAVAGLTNSCPENNRELKLAGASVEFRRSALDLERAMRKPDLTVSAGFRYLNEEGESAWVAGVSIPLAVNDKRQGAIAEARIRLSKSESEKLAAERRIHAELMRARHEYAMARAEAEGLVKTALPAAREAVAALEEGYRLGKFDFLNVLDAQRTYAELQRRHIESVASGLAAATEIERLASCDAMPAAPAPPGHARGSFHEE